LQHLRALLRWWQDENAATAIIDDFVFAARCVCKQALRW
jgi:hypothetical protein